MTLDDTVSTSGPIGSTQSPSVNVALPQKGKIKAKTKSTTGAKSSEGGKDEILINPDMKKIVVERVLNLQQRRQRGIRMKRNAPRLARGRTLTRHRSANPKQLERRAYSAAKANLRRRFAGSRGVEYQNLGPSAKIAVDTQIEPKVKSIKGVVKRILPRVRQADFKRLQAARSHTKYRKGMFPQFSSVELDLDKFNQLYEMFFKEAKSSPADNKYDVNSSEFQADVAKLKQHVQNIKGKKPKTVYDEKTRRYKVVYESIQEQVEEPQGMVDLNEEFGTFMLARDHGIVAEGGFSMHPDVQCMLDEDAATHLRHAIYAQRVGKFQKAQQHRKIAAALQRGDATAAKALTTELSNIEDRNNG